MSLYEHIFICRQDISQQQVEALTEQFSAVISEHGGSIKKTEYWGLRSMAYKVKKNRKGHYSLLNIDASHEAVAEMERQMGLNDDVIRLMTIRVDEHDEEPSAPLLNKGRDKDDRRSGRRDAAPSRNDNSQQKEEASS
ncbi:MAG: 30S ribosomal protein S6 [Parvibaculales bacterium]